MLVTPAALDHFDFAAIAPQIAGNAFPITVTAIDIYGNFKYDYSGSGAALRAQRVAEPHAAGVQQSAHDHERDRHRLGDVLRREQPERRERRIDAQCLERRKVGDDHVQRATLGSVSLTFTQQPNDAQPGPPPCSGFICTIVTKLTDLDQFGNPEVGVNVTLVVDPATNPGNDFLSGSECTPAGVCTQQADASGVATFSDLYMHVISTKYKLSASSGPTVGSSAPATAISNYFNVANQVKSCAGSCNVHAVDTFDDITATATGVTGQISIALENKSPTQAQACPITVPVGNLYTVNPTGTVSSGATLEVSGRSFHKNNGGGVGTSFLCKNSGPDTDFHVVPACSQTKPKSTPPCYVKLSGNGQGDIFFDILVAVTTAPDGTKTFDPTGYNGH